MRAFILLAMAALLLPTSNLAASEPTAPAPKEKLICKELPASAHGLTRGDTASRATNGIWSPSKPGGCSASSYKGR